LATEEDDMLEKKRIDLEKNQMKWGSVRREKKEIFLAIYGLGILNFMQCHFFWFWFLLFDWLSSHLPTVICHVLFRLPHQRILNGIWRQGRKSNFSTHSGTNLHEISIQGRISKNLEHTGTNMSFKPPNYMNWRKNLQQTNEEGGN
jgi:hypothetical protein